MPNEINQELVKAFNIILAFDETAITNLTIEVKDVKKGVFSPTKKKERIVISFDKDMSASQCMEYLTDVKDRLIEKFCGDESAANKLFDTKFFPFNFDKREWEGNKFLVPMEDGVVSNLKHFLAYDLAQFAINVIMEKGNFHSEYVEDNISDESFDKKSYLYCMRFGDRELQNSFLETLSSQVKGYENGPKDFLKVTKGRVYIKKGIFDDPKFIKDIVKNRVSLTCRDLQTPSSERKAVKDIKFTVIDLIREALPNLPISRMWHTSHIESEDEYSMLAPVIDRGDYRGFLNEEEVNHINNEVFGGTEVLRDLKDYIAEKNLPTYGREKIYAIDFADIDISYCVMNKIIESSVINKDHELSIDPERVPKLYCSPPRTPPQEEEDKDSGLGDSPPKPKDEGRAECSSSSNSPEKIPDSFKKTLLTASKRDELRPFLSPELQKKLDSNTLEDPYSMYLTYTPGGKHELRKFFGAKESQLFELVHERIPDFSKLSEKDSGFCSSFSSGLRSSFTHKNPRSNTHKNPESDIQESPGSELEECSAGTDLNSRRAK